jgi:glutamate formiminotransferase / formiminotetrahydrofolate cyclodeaminase
MTQIIECVPNFSEARRGDVVQAIVEAIKSVEGVQILNVSSDNDHNRTVVTFVGDTATVEQGAYAGIAKAAELIDLDKHTGEHPRLGATDVVPFIPIQEASIEDCVAIARRLGERVGNGLGIPVYLYEAAATRPDRENLENIRRGQYEGVKAEIESNPDRKPDFGPSKLGKAGATVIGARPFLIAYNIYLNTSDVAIANRIARAVRQSSGGLRFVKAMGVLVEGQAQVSINLTNFKKTPVHRVTELVRREATRYGASIVRSELVGMIPQAALVEAAQWYLQLDGLKDEHIFENKLSTISAPNAASVNSTQFIDNLAAATATPGGGSAGAYAGAMAAALVSMVARLTAGKKKYADVEPEMQSVITAAEKLRRDLTLAIAADIAAFDDVMAAYKMPKDSEAEIEAREEAIEQAMTVAAEVPLKVTRDAASVLGLAAIVAEKGNVNAVSDSGSAANLALASARAAAMNVRINASSIKDREAASMWLNEVATLEHSIEETFASINRTVRNRMNS